MSTFVDTSAWFAASDRDDINHQRGKQVLVESGRLVTTDHVLVETWVLLRNRVGGAAAERFWDGLRAGVARVEPVTAADLEAAWEIGRAFRDQSFSIVDRTSFAVMQRLGVYRAASFDDDFAIFRFGRLRDRAFEVLR